MKRLSEIMDYEREQKSERQYQEISSIDSGIIYTTCKGDIKMQFMLQTDNFIHNVEPPYKMDSILRVKNCLYARYIGPEDKLKFAYDKLGVYAFENDIELDGCNYTIYVDRNEEDETMVADVFMPVKE